jgi:hypothetical protein
MCNPDTVQLSLRLRTHDEDGTHDEDVEFITFNINRYGEFYRLQPVGCDAVDTEYPSIHEAICAFMVGEGYPTEDVRPITLDEFRAAEDVCRREWAKIYANDPFDRTGNRGLDKWLGYKWHDPFQPPKRRP